MLGRQATSGFAWMASQTLLTKVLAVASQVVLAWLLKESDFALVALAFATAAFPSLIQQIGVREVLIQRHLEFDKLASPATWLSLLIGCLTGLMIAGSGPIAAHLYREPKLVGLTLALGAAAPFNSLITIPLVALQAQARYRTVAISGLVVAVANPLLSIALAYNHFGAYSFILPLLITSILKLILLWVPARISLHRHLGIALWPQIIRGGFLLLVARMFGLIIGQGDYLVLGWMYEDKRVLGVYYFAFNLSMQTLVLLLPNLDAVLLPTLSKLQGQPDRQRRVFLVMAKAIAFFAFPICFLQAAVSDPAIRAIFGAKWIDAIAVFSILSVGMAFRTSGWAIHSLLPAQGRYRLYTLIHVVGAFVFMTLVITAALIGKRHDNGAVTVAVAVTLYFALDSVISMLLAIRPLKGDIRDIARIFVPPLVLGGVTIVTAAFLAQTVPPIPLRDWIRIAITTFVGGGLFLLIARRFMPDVWESIWSRAIGLLRRGGTPQPSVGP